jgi:dTDP-4-dehydrorhamnose 3,5-epimerase
MTQIPKIYKFKNNKDLRGNFIKLLSNTHNKKILKNEKIKEINYSYNKNIGTVRGMHYQIGKFKEKKIIYCLEGKILDVSINLAKKTKNKKIFKFILEAKKNNFLVIPKNYAHGYQVLKKNTKLLYFHTTEYNKKYERIINPLNNEYSKKINWPIKISKISNKDRNS